MADSSEVSKPVFIAAIVAAVVVIGALGYHFLIPHNPQIPASARQKYMEHTKTDPTTYTQAQRGSPDHGSPSSGGAPGVYQQNGGGPGSPSSSGTYGVYQQNGGTQTGSPN